MALQAAAWGPLPGARQTVIRGELMALVAALHTTDGDIIYFTDSEGVYLNFYNGHVENPEGADADLWYRVREMVRSRHGIAAVICVSSPISQRGTSLMGKSALPSPTAMQSRTS